MVATPKMKMQVELSYDDLLVAISNLPLEARMELLERLRLMAFQENWYKIAADVPQVGVSEADIMHEIKEMRNEKYGKISGSY